MIGKPQNLLAIGDDIHVHVQWSTTAPDVVCTIYTVVGSLWGQTIYTDHALPRDWNCNLHWTVVPLRSRAHSLFCHDRWSEALHGIAGSPGVHFGGAVWATPIRSVQPTISAALVVPTGPSRHLFSSSHWIGSHFQHVWQYEFLSWYTLQAIHATDVIHPFTTYLVLRKSPITWVL